MADGTEVSCYATVMAQGVSVRQLDVPGMAPLIGCGVYYGAAMTEAATYRGQPVVVVGGANSAGQGALFFSRYASQVTMLVRASSLAKGMSQYLIERIEAAPNIDVLTGVAVEAVSGTDHLESVDIKLLGGGENRRLEPAAMFLFIGSAPHTDMAAGLLELDEHGYILTGPDLPNDGHGRPSGWLLDRDPFPFETNVPGIFAVGDVRAGSGKRVAAAVGEGSGCIAIVHRYLETV
jgi:thioredoxin reductase (NADPH)